MQMSDLYSTAGLTISVYHLSRSLSSLLGLYHLQQHPRQLVSLEPVACPDLTENLQAGSTKQAVACWENDSYVVHNRSYGDRVASFAKFALRRESP